MRKASLKAKLAAKEGKINEVKVAGVSYKQFIIILDGSNKPVPHVDVPILDKARSASICAKILVSFGVQDALEVIDQYFGEGAAPDELSLEAPIATLNRMIDILRRPDANVLMAADGRLKRLYALLGMDKYGRLPYTGNFVRVLR